MEALPIHGNLRYTGYLSDPNFGLVENCRQYLCLMREVIIFSVFKFFNKVVLIKLSSSESLALEQIVKARWANDFIKFILRLRGQNDPHCLYDPVNVELW